MAHKKPLISLHGIRGFIFYVLLIQSTPSTLSEGISPVVLFSPLIIYRSFSKSSLAPGSIKGSQSLLQSKPHKSSLRPHVWGFFFHLGKGSDERYSAVVFVPMFGDSFFTSDKPVKVGEHDGFSSPCLGILFSRGKKENNYVRFEFCFRPHVWGFFFHTTVIVMMIGK